MIPLQWYPGLSGLWRHGGASYLFDAVHEVERGFRVQVGVRTGPCIALDPSQQRGAAIAPQQAAISKCKQRFPAA